MVIAKASEGIRVVVVITDEDSMAEIICERAVVGDMYRGGS
jgi:hypothetical protein